MTWLEAWLIFWLIVLAAIALAIALRLRSKRYDYNTLKAIHDAYRIATVQRINDLETSVRHLTEDNIHRVAAHDRLKQRLILNPHLDAAKKAASK